MLSPDVHTTSYIDFDRLITTRNNSTLWDKTQIRFKPRGSIYHLVGFNKDFPEQCLYVYVCLCACVYCYWRLLLCIRLSRLFCEKSKENQMNHHYTICERLILFYYYQL